MKKKVSRKEFHFLTETLEENVDRGLLKETQKKDILTYYEPSQGLDFIRVLVTLGSILIGLGILLIIVSNWSAIPALGQLGILFFFLALSMSVSFMLKASRPITSQAFLYLATLIFGASLFLINLGFNFNIQTNTLFFVWALGALLLSSLQKDLLLFLAAHVLALLFVFNSIDEFIFVQLFALIVIFFGGNYYFNYRKVVSFATLGLMTFFVVYTLNYFDVSPPMIALSVFIIGLLLAHVPHDLNRDTFRLVGFINMGVAGFSLSFPDLWRELAFIDRGQFVSVPFTLAFVVYSFALVSKRHVVPLITISVLIMRFYFDSFFDFLPRAAFFIVGGLLILGLGYWIERLRKASEDHA